MPKTTRLTKASRAAARLPLLRPFVCVLAIACAALASQAAQAQEAVSAQGAAAAVSRGAVVVDVRSAAQYGAGHLADAVSVPQLLDLNDRKALQALVSALGIDLSREVLLVGEAGDAPAQQAAKLLARYASGRVHWLVGGAQEWQMSGRALHTSASSPRAPVPQYLVAHTPDMAQSSPQRMAQAALRDIRMPMQAMSVSNGHSSLQLQ
jgi:3-mercaptopyruvate sulfurtransferase SseA